MKGEEEAYVHVALGAAVVHARHAVVHVAVVHVGVVHFVELLCWEEEDGERVGI